MKHDLLAILPGTHKGASPEGLHFISDVDFTAVLGAKAAKFRTGAMLKHQRLRGAADRQRQLEGLMQYGTVLPIAPDMAIELDNAATLLRANKPCLTTLAERLADQVQYQITVAWDAPNVLTRFQDALEIQPLFNAGSVSPRDVGHAVTKLANRLETEISIHLDAVSTDLAELPRDGDIIANYAVMVSTANTKKLDEAIEKIDKIWKEGFHIRQIGPAPAASFALISLQQIGTRDVRSAATQLGLAADWTPPQLRAAYRAALIASDGVEGQAEAVRHAANVLEAQQRVGAKVDFPLIRLWSEGHRSSPARLPEVA